ncbi:hypothetical protein DT019_37880 [Streptomyces sp. SDr-06]|uniref:hypothetical protein n=1 Tax=Streptomyces sp. SDr-06 TaxID=2267702 RepID=UPI000DEAAA79|nr:hypothetical protein [Streptomyces sp. SDr-06]RCH59778.1 hypothetical protein DT019_37880 [Streptomyces sp. SDr-06]
MSVFEVIGRLPDVQTVRDRSRALAMLDAIVCRERGYRYYSFDRSWSKDQELASMTDGSGNDYSIAFSAAGAYARAFDHESPMTPWRSDPLETWPGLFGSVPEVFRPLIVEPAFCEWEGTPRATVCFWRQAADAGWSTGNLDVPSESEDADGAEWLFDVLVAGTADAYRVFAEEYYEVPLDLAAVQHVHDLKPLTAETVSALNREAELDDLADDIAQIGYPA